MAFRFVQKVLKVSGLNYVDPRTPVLFQLNLHFMYIYIIYMGSFVLAITEDTWKCYTFNLSFGS